MTDYKPGTVATGKVGASEGTLLRAADGWYYVGPFGNVGTDSGWCRDNTGLVTDVRPLVVLDLDDIASPYEGGPYVAQALRHVADGTSAYPATLRAIADQIEEQTKPARIPEPTLWGVVRASRQFSDGKGIETTWVLHEDGRWHSMEGLSADWADLISPTLIREGAA